MFKLIPSHALIVTGGANEVSRATFVQKYFEPHEVVSAKSICLDLVGEPERPDLNTVIFTELRRRVALKLSLGERVVVEAANLRREDRVILARLAVETGVPVFYLVCDPAGASRWLLGAMARCLNTNRSSIKCRARINFVICVPDESCNPQYLRKKRSPGSLRTLSVAGAAAFHPRGSCRVLCAFRQAGASPTITVSIAVATRALRSKAPTTCPMPDPPVLPLSCAAIFLVGKNIAAVFLLPLQGRQRMARWSKVLLDALCNSSWGLNLESRVCSTHRGAFGMGKLVNHHFRRPEDLWAVKWTFSNGIPQTSAKRARARDNTASAVGCEGGPSRSAGLTCKSSLSFISRFSLGLECPNSHFETAPYETPSSSATSTRVRFRRKRASRKRSPKPAMIESC